VRTCDAPFSSDPAIYRISIPSMRIERVASLKGIQRVLADTGMGIGLTPDNPSTHPARGAAEPDLRVELDRTVAGCRDDRVQADRRFSCRASCKTILI
jgi:hypothetical protein